METNISKEEPSHHRQLELCKTRPAYRQGRKLTAVKSYTVNDESQHLFVYGVPQVNLRSELKNLCRKYGEISSIHVVTGYKTEPFTECYHVRYERVQSARIAKRLLDNRSFYGGILHVCYAPECETIIETRTKLMQRCKDVLRRVGFEESYQDHFKRKFKRKRNDEYDGRVENIVTDKDYGEAKNNFFITNNSHEKDLRVNKVEKSISDVTEIEPEVISSIKLLPVPVLKNNLNKMSCKRIVFKNKT